MSEPDPDIQNVRVVFAEAVEAIGRVKIGNIEAQEDPFGKYNLDSIQTFRILVRLEQTLNIVIGEDVTEFDRIRTYQGLIELVQAKLRRAQQEGSRDAIH